MKVKYSKNIRSKKPDSEKDTRIEGYEKTNIREKCNLIPKTSPVYYAYMLLPITKNMQDKNECCPFRNIHSGEMQRHQLQDQ